MAIECRKARVEELARINSLIAAAKGHWNYDPEYLSAALPLLRIGREWLEKHEGYSIFWKGELAGFMGLEEEGDQWLLEHLWIDPAAIGQGLGRAAMDFALRLARSKGTRAIRLWPDPPAEGFYVRMGARFTGKNVPSRVASGPLFHEMVFEIREGG